MRLAIRLVRCEVSRHWCGLTGKSRLIASRKYSLEDAWSRTTKGGDLQGTRFRFVSYWSTAACLNAPQERGKNKCREIPA